MKRNAASVSTNPSGVESTPDYAGNHRICFEGLTPAQTSALLDIGDGRPVKSGRHLAKLAELSLIARTGPHGGYEITETGKWWSLGQIERHNRAAIQALDESRSVATTFVAKSDSCRHPHIDFGLCTYCDAEVTNS